MCVNLIKSWWVCVFLLHLLLHMRAIAELWKKICLICRHVQINDYRQILKEVYLSFSWSVGFFSLISEWMYICVVFVSLCVKVFFWRSLLVSVEKSAILSILCIQFNGNKISALCLRERRDRAYCYCILFGMEKYSINITIFTTFQWIMHSERLVILSV